MVCRPSYSREFDTSTPGNDVAASTFFVDSTWRAAMKGQEGKCLMRGRNPAEPLNKRVFRKFLYIQFSYFVSAMENLKWHIEKVCFFAVVWRFCGKDDSETPPTHM